MRIILRAHGKLSASPERELVDDYLRRAQGLARGQGFLGVEEQEVETRGRSDRADQTRALLDGIPGGAKIVLMDERGKSPSSTQIAKKLSAWRDDGHSALVLVVGPADGFDASLLPKTERWAFGTQTWPHKLLRAMLAEQLFRALSILARMPYHRP